MQEEEIQKLHPAISMADQVILLYEVVWFFLFEIKISINNNLQMVMRNKILSM